MLTNDKGQALVMLDATVRDYARQIADDIIGQARESGRDPIVWVTSNRFMPPLRYFTLAERIWQLPHNVQPDAWELLTELVDQHVADASVALECPDWDNALYAVDLTRWSYEESPDGERLQDDWMPTRAEIIRRFMARGYDLESACVITALDSPLYR